MTYTVFKYGDRRRPYYVVRWKHGPPGMETGERSTKEKTRRKAEEWASKFVASVKAQGAAGDAVSWKAFRTAFEERRLPQLKSAGSYKSALNAVERTLDPKRLDELTAGAFEVFTGKLRQGGASPSTCASYAKMLRAALGWAESERMIVRAPSVRTGQTNRMRGRPLTTEEFERLLAVVPKLVGKRSEEAWRRVLFGAWSIGLRRAEFFRVYWDRTDKIHILGLNAGTPRIFFPADQHKAGKDMMLPLLPEAAEMLKLAPRSKRVGPVFLPLRGVRKQVTRPDGLGKLVAELGALAKIVTKVDPESGGKSFATIHDLRRSLGTRLAHAGVLSVPEVAQMMRHSKIETTMAHYADLNVSTLGSKLSSVEGCTLGCTPSISELTSDRRKPLET